MTVHGWTVRLAVLVLFVGCRSVLAQEPGSVVVDCAGCPEMVVIPPGEYRMGDLRGHWRDAWQPAHWVKIIYPFAVSRFEVTFEQWDVCVAGGVCSEKPNDEGWGRDRRPVIHVSWHDAQDYVRWLSEHTGRPIGS